MSCDNPYEILGVNSDASADEIRRAYKRQISEAHPDKPGGDDERARLLDEARQLLLDPCARAEYDAKLLGTDLFEEVVDALAEVGDRAVERLGRTVQAGGRALVDVLRGKAKLTFRAKRRK